MNKYLDLKSFGWKSAFKEAFDRLESPHLRPARVTLSSHDKCKVILETGEGIAMSGSFLPVVGDWVALEALGGGDYIVREILPRLTLVVRQASGMKKRKGIGQNIDQNIAANVDIALVICGLDRDFNPRRIERYVALLYACGVEAMIILNKVDVCEDLMGRLSEVEAVAPGCKIIPISATTGEGFEYLFQVLEVGVSACLMGSSGAGKSTILNRLAENELQRTAEVGGPASKGRHTTTHRELFTIPCGAVIIDNPGIREVGLAGDLDGLKASFSDISKIADNCRFRDCTHRSEPGCAVLKADLEGILSPGRLEGYHKLHRELGFRQTIAERGANALEKERWRTILKDARRMHGKK